MTRREHEQATAEAVAAMAKRFRELDAPDPDVLAREVIHMLTGRGWRPTAALPAPHWQADHGPPLPPGAVGDRADAIRASLRNPPDQEGSPA